YDLDFEGMTQTAINRLVDRGHTRIALAAPDDEINLGYVLVESYAKALAARGLAFDPDFVLRSRPDQDGGYGMAQRLLAMKERPTAIFLTNEVLAAGLYRGFLEAGV